MATCSFIKESKQTAGAMHGVMRYVAQEQKTLDEDGTRYLTGVNCMADLAYQSFMATKNLYGKAHDTFFYQYVQSFSPQERITPAEAHGIALELAERFFPDCEVLIATHLDTEHLHSHFIINSVQPNTGKKLHFTPKTLEKMRLVSDQICREHGLSTLKPYRQAQGEKGIKTGEYRAAVRGESWKFQLIAAIEDVMKKAGNREDFIREMRRRGYDVRWEDARKSITYTTPTGMKCRDDKLHERKFRKGKMENEFRIRRRAAQQRLRQIEAAGAFTDRSAPQRPLHDAHADSGAVGERPAEHSGAAGEYPLVHVGTGNEREPAATGNGGRTVKLGEQSTGTQPGDVSVHAAGLGGDAGGEPTGWEEARRVFEDALRHGAAISEGWGGYAEHVPPLDAYDVHRHGGGVHGVQHSDADLAEITEKIVRLLSRLEGSASDEVVDCTTRVYHGDRKALTKEREQKIAMGHKADDHEEQQMM